MPVPDLVPVPLPSDADYAKQSYEVHGTKRPGQTGHYRSTGFPFLTLDRPDVFVNLVEFFDSGRSRVPGTMPMLGQRPVLSRNPLKYADHYEWWTWDTVDVRRRQVGSAVHKLFADGVIGGPLRTVGIYSANTPAWQLVDLATNAYELISVSLYDTLGKDTVEYIINHTEMPIIFVAPQHIPRLLKLSHKIPTLKIIVAMDPLEQESKTILVAWGEQVGIQVMDLPELEEIGKANLKAPVYPSPDDIATICYTSGTTGQPKGVVMTHGNVANAVYAQLHGLNFKEAPTAMVFLPLAHCYGRMTVIGIIGRGGSLGYWSGDPLLLLEDIKILRPSMLPAVPRVLNRIFQAGMAAAQLPGVKGALFRRALQVKLDRLHSTGVQTHAFWDRLVFKKIQDVLGGRLLLISTGSAPMSTAAIDFLKIATNADVMEGKYGSTENVGTATRAWPWDPKAAGTVGPPHANTELKLVDVPAMNYTAEDKPRPRGEICIRSDACFSYYYRDEASTKAAIDEEGWQHTGDVGEIDEVGRVRIIDRVKNIMKLSQGEYVALERVESLYNACPVIAQLYVHGDSLQSYLIGIVIPDSVQLATIASKVWGTQVSEKDLQALDKAARDPKVNDAVLHALNKQAKSSGLQGFETIKRIYLTNEMFTVDNGCLTPTLKVKRKEVCARYKNELDAMYALPEPPSSRGSRL